jgi:SnoaL-like domain
MTREEELYSEQSQVPETRVIADRWIEAFNTRNLIAIVQLYAVDAELYDSGMARPRQGQKEIESWFRLRFTSMQGNVYTPETYRPIDEEHIAVDWTFYGHSPELLGQRWLARPFQVTGTSTFAFRNGLIVKQHGIYEHLSVLRQILPWLSWAPTFILKGIYTLYLFRNGQL